jgi:hypothetical protein
MPARTRHGERAGLRDGAICADREFAGNPDVDVLEVLVELPDSGPLVVGEQVDVYFSSEKSRAIPITALRKLCLMRPRYFPTFVQVSFAIPHVAIPSLLRRLRFSYIRVEEVTKTGMRRAQRARLFFMTAAASSPKATASC